MVLIGILAIVGLEVWCGCTYIPADVGDSGVFDSSIRS